MKFMLRCVEERYSTLSVVMAISLCTISTIHSVSNAWCVYHRIVAGCGVKFRLFHVIIKKREYTRTPLWKYAMMMCSDFDTIPFHTIKHK